MLDKLIGAGLLRQTGGPNPAEWQIEVAHEALLRNWPRLVEWLDDERVRLRRRFSLTAAAQQWAAHGKDPGGLLGGSILEEARAYDDLDAIEREFIAASQEALQREARQKRRAFRVLVGLLVLVVVLSLSFVLAMVIKTRELRQALRAEREQRNSVEIALNEAEYQRDAALAAQAQVIEARADAVTAVAAASQAVEAAEEQSVDKEKLEPLKTIIRETQSNVAAYSRPALVTTAKATGAAEPPPPPTGDDPKPPSKDPGPASGSSAQSAPLPEGLQIRASAEPTGGVVEDTKLPLYQFKIWLGGSPGALARIKSVQYEFDHPSLPNKTIRSEDRRTRFEQGYRGWGCLSSVKVTVTPVDAGVPDAIVSFDMCTEVKFRYRKK